MSWQKHFDFFLRDKKSLLLYAADPGAFRSLDVLARYAQTAGVEIVWHLAGWALEKYPQRHTELGSVDLSAKYVMLGQEVDIQRIYKVMRIFKDAKCHVYFISDHWKGIARTFKPTANDDIYLPDEIWVPDRVAYDVQFKDLISHGVGKATAQKLIHVFGHPALEHSIQKIGSYSDDNLREIREKWQLSEGKVILFVLDPLERNESLDPGYDWRDALNAAIQYFCRNKGGDLFLIKPHPRQALEEVQQVMPKEGECIRIVSGEVEPFIFLSEEVWGMTSLVLVMAKKSGKIIKSFQPNRNEVGKRHSNEHIEPYVVK